MQEIGGYLELEHFHGAMLHEGLIALNCGRACLRYLIRARHIHRIALPRYCCGCIREACEAEGVAVRTYAIGQDWLPKDMALDDGEWLYVVNAYGQLTSAQVQMLKTRYGRVILDNAQAYFDAPISGVDTIYTCRKFYGVADGGFLATDAPLLSDLQRDESHERMAFVLGRFERSASEFYPMHQANDAALSADGIQRMSRLTENILRGAEDAFIQERRAKNFLRLAATFDEMNVLSLRVPTGAFAYPLLVPDGARIRRELIAQHIYVPTLWPEVLTVASKSSWEYMLAVDRKSVV